jgi:Domain of unknown function (DUF1816)
LQLFIPSTFMQSANFTQEVVTKLVQAVAESWWVRVNTTIPHCTYYFGPFDNFTEANHARFGYVEDLIGEGAQGITVTIKRCQPTVLTDCTLEVEE